MRHLLQRAVVAGLVVAAALGSASPASAAPDKSAGTLTIEDVGSSDILSWSWGISNTITVGGGSGGAGSGKVQLQDFALTKRVNPLSSELVRATALGTHFPEVVVSVPIGGPLSPFSIEYRLRLVFVTSVQQSGAGGDSLETVSLSYGAFEQTIGTSSRFGWANDG